MTAAAIRWRLRPTLLNSSIGVALCVCAFLFGCGRQEQSAVKDIDGKYYDEDGNPTYNVHWDGTVDWYTFSGYQHFTATCLVCHGPDATGSTFAPVLANSLKKQSYAGFVTTVATGRKNNTMPSFSQNKDACAISIASTFICALAPDALWNAASPKSTNLSPPPPRRPKTNASGHHGTGGRSRKTDANRQSVRLLSSIELSRCVIL